MVPAATRALSCATLLALLLACSSDEEPALTTGDEPRGGLSRIPNSAPPTDAEKALDPASEGWDTEVLGAHAKEHVKELLHLGHHPESADVAALSSADVEVAALRPQPLTTVRESAGFLVQRADPTADTTTGHAALAAALTALFEPFESEPEVHVKVVRVEPRPGLGATTTLYYQAVGRSDGRPYQQNATWVCGWDLEGRLLVEVRTLQHEEVHGPAGVEALFTECTAGVFNGDETAARQLSPSLDDLAATTDITVGAQIAEYEGIAVGDANGDGLDDLYLCQTRGMPNRLYLQRPDGTVQDGTRTAGVDLLDRTHAALFLDLDGDRDQDLVVGGLGLLFFENKGNEPAEPGGVPSPRYELLYTLDLTDNYSIAAADVDLDKDLDLYICRYRATEQSFPMPYHDAQNGLPNAYLRNDGDWKFTDATEEAGFNDNNNRFSFAVSFADYDSDGDPDLYVANDFGRNNLYRNDGGVFSDAAAELGVEDISAGMSADWGDPDSDGDPDIYIGNMFSAAGNRIAYQRKFQTDADAQVRSAFQRHARGNSLFLNQGGEVFTDVSVQAGVTMGRWSWCSQFVDLDNDCREDLVVSNGYITSTDDEDL